MRLFRVAVGAGLALGALVGVQVVAALACTSIATLNLNQTSGAAGTNLTVTGSSFATIASGGTAVSIRWNGVEGPVLAQVTPDASGSISAAVTVPANVEPGYYIITATQNGKDGTAAFGTPARLAFQVLGPNATSAAQQPGAQPVAQAPTGSGFGIGASTAVLLGALGVAGLLLFLLGAATFVGSFRRLPATSPVRRRP